MNKKQILMKRNMLLLCTAILLLAACGRKEGTTSGFPIVDSLLREMTLQEKIGQLVLYTSYNTVTGPTMRDSYMDDIRAGRCGSILNACSPEYVRSIQEVAVNDSRLGIPLLFGFDVIHGYKTIFPINLGLAATWNLDAVREAARIAAVEAAADGLNWTYSPMCDISTDPRWGRVSEGSGEDPYLGSLIAAETTRGYQGASLADTATLLACVKHFAAYGAPQAGRDYNTVDMSERWLREFYLPPYKAAIDAGALSVMTSFNELDGIPATANTHLLKDILRDEWGFKGFVVTDYTSINEMINHGYAADSCDAARLSILAGVDMDMQSAAYMEFLEQLVEEGKVDVRDIDRAARRILEVKAALGLFEDPYRYCDTARSARELLKEEHLSAAREIAAESMVLLKNDGTLPMKTGGRVAVIGFLANSAQDMLGSWCGQGSPDDTRTILEVLHRRNRGGSVTYAEGCRPAGEDRSGFAAALSAARSAETVVMVMGEYGSWSGEAASRADIRMPGVQTELLEKIAAMGKKIVLVVMSGRPLDLTRESQLASSVLDIWFPGTMGAEALADVLYGDVNPSGRLTMTFPRSTGQIPIYYYAKNTGRPHVTADAKYESRYLDSPNEPLYPFGYGLSYTEFSYSPVTLSKETFSGKDALTVSVRITNTGTREGTETVQLYIRDLVGSVTRPVKQLKGFERVKLAPGESREVRFEITAETLSFYRQDMSFGPESGDFIVYVGPSSAEGEGRRFSYKTAAF